MDDSGETRDATSTGGTHPIGSAQTLPARPHAVALRSRVGRYVIGKRLGAGGMGEVWEATDPELGRRVAIKLLRGGGLQPQLADRLRREAQALAKLDHPNVVTVHDVGVDETGELYIVMQLIAGTTLDQAIEGKRAAEVTGLLAQAGRGLAAAHAAGIVHRDFKPTNVLVDPSGHVRVSDFGLARAADTADEDAEGGEVAGTPAYMAPEQLRGESVTHATDQFAFCVTLWEALAGTRPFAGKDLAALREAVAKGPPKEPPPSIPRRLRSLLARGLSVSPDARYPSMDALLAELEPSRRVLWIAGGVGVAGLATTALLLGVTRPEAGDPCRGVDQPIEGVWNDAQRAGVRATLGMNAPGIIAILDGRATRWRTMRLDACAATHAERDPQTLDERDERYACLDTALIDQRAAVVLLTGKPDGKLIARASQLAVGGRDPEECTRSYAAERVKRGTHVGLDPALTIEVAAAEALRASGHIDAYLARRDQLEPRIVASGDQDAMYRWFYDVGLALAEADKREQAREPYRRAAEAAAAIRRDDLVARAWSALAEVTAQSSDLEAAENLLVNARGAAKRSGRPLATVWVELSDGEVAIERGKYKEAIALCSHALDGARELGLESEYLVESLGCVYDAQVAAEDHEGAITTANKKLERLTATYGPGAASVVEAERGLATALDAAGQRDEAHAHWKIAFDGIAHVFGPESQEMAWALRDLATAETPDGAETTPEAIAATEKAAAIAEKTLSPTDPMRAQIFETQAYVLGAQKKYVESLVPYERALAVYEKVDDPLALGRVLYNMADTLKELKQCERALPLFERAAKVAATTGQATLLEGGALYGRGYCLGYAKQWAEADAALRLAITRFDAQDMYAFGGQTRWELAEQLVKRGKRDEGIAMAKEAAAKLEGKPPPAPDMRKEILDWIKKN